jgi:hypothetical protein
MRFLDNLLGRSKKATARGQGLHQEREGRAEGRAGTDVPATSDDVELPESE